MGDKIRVGRHDGRIQKMLYEKVVLATITYNTESTTNMTNKEMEDMEMIQGKKAKCRGKYTTYFHQPLTGVTD